MEHKKDIDLFWEAYLALLTIGGNECTIESKSRKAVSDYRKQQDRYFNSEVQAKIDEEK